MGIVKWQQSRSLKFERKMMIVMMMMMTVF